MKTQYFKIIVIIALFSLITASCTKKEVLPDTPIVGLGGDTWAKGPIDDYILTNFTNPYNIEVKYKWDPYELDISKALVPVIETNVMPSLNVVKQIWIDPYDKIAGAGFIKKYSPKQFVLVGSAQYNSNGTITLGEAEGGRKITLFVINSFDRKNLPEVIRMMHTIEHEFAHILHQTILYPQAFKTLNPEWYTATWFNNTDADANAQGLVTAYSKAAVDEDFVETVSFLLVEGQARFDAIVAGTNAKAAGILRQKEAIVVSYFKTAYNIDFRALQAETKAAIIKATT
ncbi:MAG: zinc-binding metallopeptidase [Janthinobacterium lividum]